MKSKQPTATLVTLFHWTVIITCNLKIKNMDRFIVIGGHVGACDDKLQPSYLPTWKNIF